MAGVNIKGTFKKDERPNNGLEAVAADLTSRPHERRIVVALVRPVRTVIDHADGTQTPTVQFDHIEVLEDDAGKEAWELMAARYEERTGNPMPPVTLFDNPNPRELDPDEPLPGLEP